VRESLRRPRARVRALPVLRRHRAHREPVAGRAGGVRAPVRPPRRLLIEALLDFVWRLGYWGYLLVFLGAALESAAFLGFLVPGESIVVIAGLLASWGVLELPETLVIAVTGAITGDNVGYQLGHRLGRPWLERHGRLVGMHGGALARTDALFQRHGGKAVLIGRFVGFLRAMLPFVAGASRMSYPRFLVFNAIGATSWGIFFVLLGYFVGASWPLVERWLGRVGFVVGALVIAATVWWLRRHHRQAPGG
jgi:undecaprenyl-diphosphatase